MIAIDVGSPKQISASTAVASKGGTVIGIFCSNAGSTSKIALTDGVASGASAGVGRFVAPFVPSAGTFHRIGASYGTGLYVTLAGSAQNITVVYQPGSS